MRDLAILCLHLITTALRLLRPGGARLVIVESLLVKQQLLIINRSRQTRTEPPDDGSHYRWAVRSADASEPAGPFGHHPGAFNHTGFSPVSGQTQVSAFFLSIACLCPMPENPLGRGRRDADFSL